MRLCKEAQTTRDSQRHSFDETSAASTTTSAPVGASAAPTPFLAPLELPALTPAAPTFKTAEPANPPPLSPDRMMEELSEKVMNIEVDAMPLGLDAPDMVVDLDSFVEAVTACVDDSRRVSIESELGSPKMDGGASSARRASADGPPPLKPSLSFKIASAALAGAAVATVAASAFARSRGASR